MTILSFNVMKVKPIICQFPFELVKTNSDPFLNTSERIFLLMFSFKKIKIFIFLQSLKMFPSFIFSSKLVRCHRRQRLALTPERSLDSWPHFTLLLDSWPPPALLDIWETTPAPT